MPAENCAKCGLSFDPREMPDKKTGEELGRQVTKAGPMHFGCYWHLVAEATAKAIDEIAANPLVAVAA